MLLFPKSREEWLDIRKGHVSSTESSALFGMSPYSTAFELAVAKKSDAKDEDFSSERMSWGIRLQRAIAQGIAEDYGVNVRSLSAYASRAPDHKIGASFDFEIVGIKTEWQGDEEHSHLRGYYKQHGPGVLEIKNVDGLVFKNEWEKIEKAYEAPPHIEIQVQHQLECIEREWAAIGVLVGGNRQIVLVRMRDRDVGVAIRAKVGKFSADLANGIMPPVSLPEDAETIRKLYGTAEPGSVLDFQTTENAEIHQLVADHEEATKAKSAAEKNHKSTGARLLMAIGTAERVLFKDFSVSAGMVGPTRVEAYDRAGYRNLRVYTKGAKK